MRRHHAEQGVAEPSADAAVPTRRKPDIQPQGCGQPVRGPYLNQHSAGVGPDAGGVPDGIAAPGGGLIIEMIPKRRAHGVEE
jgi:hypothetical protein